MGEIAWALVPNLHQPAGNIEDLLATQEWETTDILWAMDRIPRSLWGYEDVARVHLSLSGTLLETLSSPQFQRRVYGIVDCGSLLWHLQNTALIDVLGTGYYHLVLPLIPPADWAEQLERWRGIAGRLFNRQGFDGFWPPEMGFTVELIPLLRRLGYRYVLVDSEHVRPVGAMRWEELRYRPHLARFGGEEIVVVVRDRDLSNAQESGREVDWFLTEVVARTRHCDFPPLVTTCTDGENGGWFRNTGHNFWTRFYQPLLDRVRRSDSSGLRPTFLSDYLHRHGAHGEVTVGPGAWNTGWHHGHGFVRWTGSTAQQQALTRLDELSEAVHAARRNATGVGATNPRLYHLLEEAHWRVLRAETSCNFFWGGPGCAAAKTISTKPPATSTSQGTASPDLASRRPTSRSAPRPRCDAHRRSAAVQRRAVGSAYPQAGGVRGRVPVGVRGSAGARLTGGMRYADVDTAKRISKIGLGTWQFGSR